ncbi:MAG: hypothetical protein A4S12_05905 [Proteobacteria bacterium SG_bin5]|nr:PH domain-containing protein [Sphingomonas sp.]OQW43005.1 MAG: hypothetical protein A4S12_05905 [Proteobacteria bacterium SG_bin5]
MIEYEIEPIPGLPGRLPPGERVLWQGQPRFSVLARSAFHTGAVAVYFAALVAVALIGGAPTGALLTILAGAAGVGLLYLLAWVCARTTRYTLTNKRLVLRIGMAVPKCINLPLAQIAAVDFRARAGGTGDLVIRLARPRGIGYALLWPHARAWRYNNPQPMLRAVPDAAKVGMLVARTVQAAQGGGTLQPVAAPDARPTPSGEAVAA